MPNLIFDGMLIDKLGGTGETARLLNRSDSCVSLWRKTGIPSDTRQLIKYKRPKIYKKVANEIQILLSTASDDKIKDRMK